MGDGTGRGGTERGVRGAISTAFARMQDVVYVGLAVVFAACALALVVHGGIDLVRALVDGDVREIVFLLDRTLLALMVVELLYTVQVSFREHTLVPEPFILVAIIAAVRRILVITAEMGAETRPEERLLRILLWELGLLAAMIAVFVVSLVVLRRAAGQVAAGGHEAESSAPPPGPAQPRREG